MSDIVVAKKIYNIKLPQLHPGQEKIREALRRKRFVIACFGRRAGKTTGGTIIMLDWALRWKRQVIWWVAPTRNICKISWRIFNEICPRELIQKMNQTDMEITLINGSRVAWKSADRPYTLLGEGLNFLVVDEAAEVKEEVWRETLRPALSDKEGSALIMSRPHGANWFYEEYLKGVPDENGVTKDPDYISLHLESRENPFFPPEEWEKAKRQLPRAVFDQEYRALFSAGASAVFATVDEVLVPSVQPAGGRRFMGVDPARSRDYSAIVVLDLQRQVVACKAYRGLSLHLLAEIIERMAEEWNAEVWIDSHVIGQGLLDFLMVGRLAGRIHPFPVKDRTTRRELIEELALALDPVMSKPHITIPAGENKDFQGIPDGESLAELYRELRDMDYKVTSTQDIVYVPGMGGHDDLVMALALANWGWRQHFGSTLSLSQLARASAMPAFPVSRFRHRIERKYSARRYR